MGRKRTTRQLIIDWSQSNEVLFTEILERMERIIAVYNEDALNGVAELYPSLEAARMFQVVLKNFTLTTREL